MLSWLDELKYLIDLLTNSDRVRCIKSGGLRSQPILEATLEKKVGVFMELATAEGSGAIVRSRSRSRLDFEIFLHLPQYKLSSPRAYISALADVRKL